MEGQDWTFWILPMATAVGAFGGFPEPPAVFKNLAQNELFQWLMVFVLTWQGGGAQNVRTALIATLMLFIISKLMSLSAVATPLQMVAAAAPGAPAAGEEKFYYN